MERFIPIEVFRKKGIPSKVILYSRFHRSDRSFLYHLIALLEPGSSARAQNIAIQNMAGSSDSYGMLFKYTLVVKRVVFHSPC